MRWEDGRADDGAMRQNGMERGPTGSAID
jgi:hypothetical protein